MSFEWLDELARSFADPQTRHAIIVHFPIVLSALGAIGLLVPRTRRLAAIALLVFLAAVLPANIYAAREQLSIGGSAVTPMIPRIAMQLFFAVLIWWSSIRPTGTRWGQTMV